MTQLDMAAPEPSRPGTAVPDPSRLRVALASSGDADSPAAWSGTPFHMASGLRGAVGEVTVISPIKPALLKPISMAARFQGRLTGLHLLPRATWMTARANARTLTKALAADRPDILLTPAGSELIAALETDIPIAYSSDATVKLMIDYYGQFTGLARAARRQADAVESAAIHRADLLLYPTEWAARSAVEDYGADPAKIHVLPYGANFGHLPGREAALAPRAPGPLRLVFVGVDWVRKGGAIAAGALRALNDRGIETELTVVGCVPPDDVPRDRMTVHPFLSKTDPEQARTLSDLLLNADLMLLPTRAECFGVVFCEAAAHGLPSITTATGGVPDVVHEGVTGHCLPLEAEGGDYADLIAGLAGDRARLDALRLSARDDFETRLDWAVWGRDCARLFAGLTGPGAG